MLDVRESVIALSYIVAAVLFIFGLKQLSSPATARAGNRLAAIGMTVALGVTLLDRQIVSFWTIAIGTLIGAAIGIYFARTVQMTAMPQMVALFNGMGGATAALVFISAFGGHEFKWKEVSILFVILVVFSVLVFVKGLTLPFPLCPDFIENCPIR